MKVCFVSTKGNVRAVMAKSIFTKLSRMVLLNIEVFFAGIVLDERVPQEVIKVLQEKGYPTENLKPAAWESLFQQNIDILITLSSEARDGCPYYINHKRREHWALEEVSNYSDLTALKNLRDRIEKFAREFLKIS